MNAIATTPQNGPRAILRPSKCVPKGTPEHVGERQPANSAKSACARCSQRDEIASDHRTEPKKASMREGRYDARRHQKPVGRRSAQQEYPGDEFPPPSMRACGPCAGSPAGAIATIGCADHHAHSVAVHHDSLAANTPVQTASDVRSNSDDELGGFPMPKDGAAASARIGLEIIE